MTDYQKYINALRKCAKEHENDRTFTGHIIVSDLCRDTANLLEELSSSEKSNKSEIPKNSPTETLVSLDVYKQVARERDIAIQQLHELGYEFGQKIQSTSKNNLVVDKAEQKTNYTWEDVSSVMDAMEYKTNSLIENIKSEILHFANVHCSGDDINIYDVFKVIDDCCEPSNSEKTNKSETKIDCDNTDCNNCVNHKYCDYEPTTKNGISNSSIIYKAKESKEIQEDLDKLSKLKEPTTKDDVANNNVNNIYKCSCGYGWDKSKVSRHHFCPNCGKAVETTSKNDLGVDCIDRQATLDAIIKRLGIKNESYLLPAEKTIYQQIKDMSSVTPIQPKGHWIPRNSFLLQYKCSECNCESERYNFCPNCGAKMESEKV